MDFDWHDEKNDLNIQNHDFDIAEISEMFDAYPSIDIPHVRHGEQRYKRVIYVEEEDLYLSIIYTWRDGDTGQHVRVISIHESSEKDARALDERLKRK